MPLHLMDAKHKYRPEIGEKVFVVFKNHNKRTGREFLDIAIGMSHGRDPIHWKEGYKIVIESGWEDICSPSLLYPLSFNEDEIRRCIASRLGGYVFPTEEIKEERGHTYRIADGCMMCADRDAFWAVSPPIFLSRESRKWHLHIDCLFHVMPRHQFKLNPVDVVDYN